MRIGIGKTSMRKIKRLFLFFFLLCPGCALIQYNSCGEGIPPENADADFKRLFKNCSSSTGVSLGDKFRLYYVAYAEGNDAEQKARRIVAEKIRRDITGKRRMNIPLYNLEAFKHFRYGDHFWGIYFIPRKEHDFLRKKYYE